MPFYLRLALVMGLAICQRFGAPAQLILLYRSQKGKYIPPHQVKGGDDMKRLLLLALVAMMVAVTTSTKALAQEEEECPCGVDEEGQCIPCDFEEWDSD
jgi:hypothetical protein